MNLFDKLALSLLVCCGMMVSQIEAALPGAFSKVAESQADGGMSIRADSGGSVVSDATAPEICIGFLPQVEVSARISATVKGYNRTYLYDAAGYVYDDGKRTYEWTSFGQLEKLEYLLEPELKDFSGNIVHAAGTKVVSEFDFDSGGNRARQIKERVAANDSRKIENTLYLGSYERVNHLSKTDGYASAVLEKIVHRHTLGGGVIYTRTVGGTSPGVRLTNVLADHLGSTDVLLVGKWNSSTSSFVHERTEFQSFDAWGERRAADTQVNYRTSDTDPFRTSAEDYERGYTGHEQLDDSGLIHMNGRIYDPELGRFLSPDPYVQIPEYSQNFFFGSGASSQHCPCRGMGLEVRSKRAKSVTPPISRSRVSCDGARGRGEGHFRGG